MPKQGKSELKLEYSSRVFTVPKNLEYEFIIYEREMEYTFLYSKTSIIRYLRSLHDVVWWNTIMCLSVLASIVMVMVEDYNKPQPRLYIVDAVFNLLYAVHAVAVAFIIYHRRSRVTMWEILGFLADALTFTHYLVIRMRTMRLFVYCARLHRPLQYQWSNSNYNIKSSIWGTAFKIAYLNFVLRIGWTVIWIYVHELNKIESPVHFLNISTTTTTEEPEEEIFDDIEIEQRSFETLLQNYTLEDFTEVYFQINRMYIPVGTTMDLSADIARVLCVLVQMSGCLMLAGAAIATLSLVFSIYLAPEEEFRSRYRLIMKELKSSRVSAALRDKVETFYMIYWKKHNAVSTAALMPGLPPTLTTAINFDIYFEATQKSRMLKDTPNHFLTEVMKSMTTIHYIPGDTIIGRGSQKHSMYYITYGDIEMLTAEDDNTAILRMTRGTVLTPCSPCTVVACGHSHVQIRAATFCTAQVLNCAKLWKKTLRQSKHRGRAAYLLWAFQDHLDKVKIHYNERKPNEELHRSSIKAFKHGLIALKNAKDSLGNLIMPRQDVFLEIAGSYITRSDIESTLTDQSDAICLRQRFPCILQASSSLLDVWHCFVAILTVMVVITHPYFMAFAKKISSKFYYFDRVVTIVYVIDLIVYLSTGTNVEEGIIISFSNTALYQIRQPRFVIDVFATIPIFEFIYDGHFGGVNKLLKIPQLFASLKNVEDNCVYHSHVLRFCTFTVMVVMICYLIAFVQQAVMCFGFEHCVVRNFTHEPHWQQDRLDEDVVGRVTFNLYWAVSLFTLTSHMYRYVRDKFLETCYALFFLELAMQSRIFMEASYSAAIMVTSAMRQNFDSFIGSTKDFLVRKDIDPILQHRFITYLELCWYTDNAYSITHEKHSIFYDLPPHVYQDIVAKQRSSYLNCIPFMKLLHRGELRVIASRARLFYTSPNEILLNTGDYTDEIFIIKQGILEMVCPVTRKPVRILKSRNHAAALECLLKFPAYYTYRAVTHVQIMSVKKRFFYVRCLEVPQIKNVIDFVKTQPEFKALYAHTYRSFGMYQYPPKPPNRQIFKQRRKFEQDFEFLMPFTQLGFLSVLRYVFPRFTIRPDSKYLERYEWFRAFCALLASAVFPSYEYVKLYLPELTNLARLLDFTAYFDMFSVRFQRTIIGYYNEKGILIYHPSSTLAHYLRGAFIVDLIACVPLEHLQPLTTIGDHYRLDMLRQGLMLNRLLQLYRFFQTIEALHIHLRQDIMLVLKSLPLFMTLVNVLTVFIVLSSSDITFPKGPMKGNETYRIVPFNDRGGSWVELYQGIYSFNMTENVVNFHLATYFWVVYEATSTGYKTLNPSNPQIMKVLFVGMVISSMITTYFSVRVISVRSNINVALCNFQEHKRDIQTYMVKEKLDDNLKKMVRNFYDYNWDNMGGVETRSLLKLCDQVSLRTDCILHIYGATFQECPILPHHDMSLMRVLSRCIRDAYFVKKMELMITDDVVHHMYFVSKGVVHIRVVGKTMCKIVKLNRGSVFGNFERNAIRMPATAVANTNVHLLQIKSKLFHDITRDNPSVNDLLNKFRPGNEMYICTQSKDMRGHRRVKRKTLSTINVTEAVQTKFRTEDVRVTIVLALITYSSMTGEIYNMCYQLNNRDIIITLYILDLLFTFKIAFLVWVPNSKDSHKFRAMRTKYLKGEFPYDLTSCIPIELFAFLLPADVRWLWFSWLRIGRMFRVITLYKCLRRKRKKLTTNLAASTVLTVAVWFTFSIHCISCAFYYLATIEDYLTPNSSWRYNSKGEKMCNNEYICSMYFIMTTFTHNGVGDVMPRKHSEVIIVAILEIVSTMMYMVYVGEFSNIVQYESYRSFTFYSQFLQLEAYLHNNRVSEHLIDVIRQYCLHLWRESRGYQLPHFLTTAPQPLKLQIMTAAYFHHLDRHPVFRHCETAFLRQLTGCLKMFTYNEDLMIVKENEITDSMYFIHQGTVQESSEKEGIMRIYVTREYFGEFQGLNRNEPYRYSYQSVHKSQILMLQLDDWEYLLNHFPRSKAAIYGGPMPDDDRGNPLALEEIQAEQGGGSNIFAMPSMASRLSSTYSFVSRLRATSSVDQTPTAPSRTSHMIRFTGSSSSTESIVTVASLAPAKLEAPPPEVEPPPQPTKTPRLSIRFPFSAKAVKETEPRPSLAPRKSHAVLYDLLQRLTAKKNENQESLEILTLFSEDEDSKDHVNKNASKTQGDRIATPRFSRTKVEGYRQASKVSITISETNTIRSVKELPERIQSTRLVLPEKETEGPSNRQVIYLSHDPDKTTSKVDFDFKGTKQKENIIAKTDSDVKEFIIKIVEDILENIFKNLDIYIDQQVSQDMDNEGKFEVFIQGKAFAHSKATENVEPGKESKKIVDEKPDQENDIVKPEQTKLGDTSMVEIFVDTNDLPINEDHLETDENARIKAFAASQAAKDASKKIYEPKKPQKILPKKEITSSLRKLQSVTERGPSVELTFSLDEENAKLEENERIKAIAKQELASDLDKMVRVEDSMYSIQSKKEKENKKNRQLKKKYRPLQEPKEVKMKSSETGQENKKLNKILDSGGQEKFEVFTQGKAFANVPKSDAQISESSLPESLPATKEDGIKIYDSVNQDEKFEVFTQGRAFANVPKTDARLLKITESSISESQPETKQDVSKQVDNDYQEEKFEVFTQGRAFANVPKSDAHELKITESSIPDSQPDTEIDQGEFVEVLVQGKAFEKNKEEKKKDEEQDLGSTSRKK